MTDKKSPTLADPLDPEQVADYLRHHPEFFVDHQELLGDLFLPHESGPAVSLVERQLSILRERNIDLRNRLRKLLDNARENDKLFEKTKRLVLTLLEVQDLPDIVDALHYCFDKEFGIRYTSLLLFGSETRIPGSQAKVIPLVDARNHLGALLKSNRAMCGTLGQNELNFI